MALIICPRFLGLTDSWQQQLYTVAVLSVIQFAIPVTQFAPNWRNMLLKANFLTVVNFEYLEMALISKDHISLHICDTYQSLIKTSCQPLHKPKWLRQTLVC